MPTETLARARRVRLLTCDVDGVLTDGRHLHRRPRARDEGVLRARRRRHQAAAPRRHRGRAGSPAAPRRRSRIARGGSTSRTWCSTPPTSSTAWEALRTKLGLAAGGVRAHRRRPPRRAGAARCGFAVTRAARARCRARARTLRDRARRRRGAVREARRAHPGRPGPAVRIDAPPPQLGAATMAPRSTQPSLDRATAWSPVLLLGSLAALTFWLDAQVQPPAARATAPRGTTPTCSSRTSGPSSSTAGPAACSTIAGKRARHYRRRPDHRVRRSPCWRRPRPASRPFA